jgi:hypothetical protein
MTGAPGGFDLNLNRSVTVGYTKYKTEERYITKVMIQRKSIFGNDYYFINIPLYGYKKE